MVARLKAFQSLTGWPCAAVTTAVVLALGSSMPGAENDDAPEFYRRIDISTSGTTMHSRDPGWKPADGVSLEITGMATVGKDGLAVSVRKGEVWMLQNVYSDDPNKIRFSPFATGLDEPLGLILDGSDLLTVQRSEMTRLRDSDGDGTADAYFTVARGWNVSGAYHGYAYGPVRDGSGKLWISLNLDLGPGSDNAAPWRGWALRIGAEDGRLEGVAAGLRSPCGLGVNGVGDVFATDQQGNWVPTNSLLHLRDGAYFGNPDGMPSAKLPQAHVPPLPDGVAIAGKPYPEALRLLPMLRPPAVWFPYLKMGQSRTGLAYDRTDGSFGPYAGQFFVGEFTQSKIGRVFLERVDGQYQGACFPFLDGFPAAVLSLEFGRDGSLFVGMTNRGWSSVGGGSYGLQRLVWGGRTPFEVLEMRATPDGFDLVFTGRVDPETGGDPASYSLVSYTYPLQPRYGGDEILTESLDVLSAAVSPDGTRVRLTVDGLRKHFVHELNYGAVLSSAGERPWHDSAYYTLNAIPDR